MRERTKKFALPAMLVGAVLTALTLIFPKIGFLEWITLIPLFWGTFFYCADQAKGLWRTYWAGFFTIFIYYFAIYHWFLSLYPLDFIGMDNVSSAVVVAYMSHSAGNHHRTHHIRPQECKRRIFRMDQQGR